MTHSKNSKIFEIKIEFNLKSKIRLFRVTKKDISELEKYWNETLSTENEKSRSLPRFRSLEPYSLTLARRESENNREEDSYQLSDSVLI